MSAYKIGFLLVISLFVVSCAKRVSVMDNHHTLGNMGPKK